MLNDTGGEEQAVAARVRAVWMKFRELDNADNDLRSDIEG